MGFILNVWVLIVFTKSLDNKKFAVFSHFCHQTSHWTLPVVLCFPGYLVMYTCQGSPENSSVQSMSSVIGYQLSDKEPATMDGVNQLAPTTHLSALFCDTWRALMANALVSTQTWIKLNKTRGLRSWSPREIKRKQNSFKYFLK